MATRHKKHDGKKPDAKKSDAKKSDAKKPDVRKSDAKKSDAKKSDPKKPTRKQATETKTSLSPSKDQPKHERLAEQALLAAEAAVAAARHAVQDSSKKLRKRAEELHEETAKLVREQHDAVQALASTPPAAAIGAVVGEQVPSTSSPSGVPSMIELRAHAKRLGLTGVSRLSKAQLQAHLEHVEAERQAAAATATD